MGGDRELEIGSIVELVAPGRPMGVLAEPGMGITTVLEQAVRRLPAPVCRGGALRTLRTVPHLPLSRALGVDAAHVGADLANLFADRVGDGVLVLDDLQWADPATLVSLESIAERIRVLVGIRIGDDGTRPAQAALRAAGGTHVRLSPLDADTALALVRDRRPELADVDARRLVAEAAGNPLVLDQLLATGEVAAPLAEGLRGAVAGLGGDARRLLAMLAERPEGVPAERTGPEAMELFDLGLATTHDGAVVVRHRLVAHAALDGLADDERAGLHRVLADLAASTARRAHHLAAAGERAAALPLARAAADDADAGERHHLLALASRCADGQERLELAVAAVDAAIEAWDRPAARALAEHAVELPGAGEAPEVLAAVAEARARDGDSEAAHDAARRVPDSAPAPVRARARAAASVAAAWPLWQPSEAVPAAEEAACLASSVAVDRAVAVAGMVGGSPAWVAGLGHMPIELAPLASLWAGIDAGSLPTSGPPADIELLATVLAFHGTADCDGTAVRLRRAMEDAGRPIDRELVTAHLVVALADSGRTAAAADLAVRALGDQPTPAGEALLRWSLVEAEVAGGRLVRAAKAATVANDAPASPARCLTAVAASWAAALAPDRAELPGGIDEPAWPGLRAAMLEQQALQLRGRGSPEAADAFAEAASAWSTWHRRGQLRCRWASADSLVATDTAAAIAALRDLEPEATALGQRPLVARIRGSLRSAGVRSRPTRGAGRGPLSAREVEVLELVRLGFTTNEAAQSLGVAASTVETQIESAMRKLGARTRLQAAVEMAGLVP